MDRGNGVEWTYGPFNPLLRAIWTFVVPLFLHN